MTPSRHLIALIVLTAAAALAPAALAAPYAPSANNEGANAQAGVGYDTANASQWGWSNTTATVLNRPFVRYLSITNPGDPGPTVIINNPGSTSNPTVELVGGQRPNLYAFVSPINGCRTGQTPQQGVCYANPNRVAVHIAAQTGATSFTDNVGGTETLPAITENSVIHLRIGLKAAYSSLRWSWVNGIPSYWRNTVIPGVGGEVEVRFTPRTMPVMSSGGCSAIPVNTCDIQRADFERLQPQIILSMDDTLDAGLTGVLFGSSGAFIGSLESSPIGSGQAPTLTYGIAAPHENADGTDRVGTFYALIPGAILSLFGTGVEAFDQSILAVERTNGAGTFDIGWSAWNATDNGTAGQFLTISNISFSAPKFEVKRRAAPSTGTAPPQGSPSPTKTTAKRPTVKAKRSITLARLAQGFNIAFGAGSTLSARVSTPKVCRATRTSIRGIAPGTCNATITVKPKRGKATTNRISFQVTR